MKSSIPPVFMVMTILAGSIRTAIADTHIWDGGSATSGNWSTPANWVGNVAPSPGDSLVFPNGVAKVVSTNNYAANTPFTAIVFQGSSYHIHGNPITLGNHLTMEGGATGVVFRPDIRLGASSSLIRAQNSGLQLTLLGNINLNGHDLYLVSQGELRCSGAISGIGNIQSSGSGRTVFNGSAANTYMGETHLADGILELSKYFILFPSGAKIASTAVPGNLIIGVGSSPLINDAVVCNAGSQIASGAQVTLHSSGELNLNGYNNTIYYLQMMGGYVTTGNGTLTVTGNVLCEPDADGSVISGHFDMGPFTLFTVNENALLAVSAEISGTPSSPLYKQGLGELRLSGSNSFGGSTVLQAGALSLYNAHALGVGTATTTVDGGRLTLGNFTFPARPLVFNSIATLSSLGANSVWRGNVGLSVAILIDTPVISTLTLSGIISGPGGFRKSGLGTLRFAGTLENLFSGQAIVQEGTLELSKSFNSLNLISVPGMLVVGDGVTPGAALVRHGAPGQVADTSQVTVNSDGVWDLNGWPDRVGGLTLEGGTVQTHGGTLELGGDVQVNASAISAVISGEWDLGGAPRTFNVADGAALYDLAVAAEISGGPGSALIKAGPGVMRIAGDTANTYSGPTAINEGVIRLSKLPGLLAVPGDLTIGNGTDGPNSAIVIAHLHESIADTAVVTIHESGLLDLNGHDETIGPLILSGPGSIITGTGTLILGGDVTVNASTGPAVITGNLSLGMATRTLDVADGLDAYDLSIAARISGASGVGWRKEGAGTLRLSGANTFSGPAQVVAGTLHLGHPDALGATAMGSTLDDHTALSLGINVVVGSEPLILGDATTVTSYSANNAWAGDVVLNGHTMFRSVNFSPSEQLVLSGAISGPGSLQLISGQLTLSGNTPNTYAGATIVSEHTLILSKSPGITAVPGTLIVGNGTSGDTVRLDSEHQIADAGTVQVAYQGRLDLNNHSEEVGSLEGAGDVTLGSATLTTGGNNATTLISGVINGSGGVVKAGTGTFRLSGNHTYTGLTHVNGGALQVDGSLASPVVHVQSGSLLGGTGAVQAVAVHAGGAMAPGTSPGVFAAAGNVSFSGGELRVELNGATVGANYDQLVVAGQVSLTGSLLTVAIGSVPEVNATFTILNNTGQMPVVGTFDGLPEGGSFAANGLSFEITYTGGDGNDVVLTRLQAAAPSLTGVAPLSDGSVQVTGLGGSELAYLIQAAENLVAPINWQTLGAAQADSNGVFDFIDPEASKHPRRFYRSVNP